MDCARQEPDKDGDVSGTDEPRSQNLASQPLFLASRENWKGGDNLIHAPNLHFSPTPSVSAVRPAHTDHTSSCLYVVTSRTTAQNGRTAFYHSLVDGSARRIETGP
ncbi:hypothetical protein BCV70DRAFT_202492 [Testicularia cyperi]|uniref:Uncharacterized protein n=1 Tax=Testicularia cyperi TaxID=1882483 RepID=A0A317XHJ1_9BASI|nr:hypothetical protein BCV70DRAFT_202492 [Testicularia cyperi]